MVTAEPAKVYRGGGRRWLSLRAACNAEARKKVLAKHCDCERADNHGYPGNTCDYHKGDERLLSTQRHLARLYLRAARSPLPEAKHMSGLEIARSSRREVRNPLLALPSVQRLLTKETFTRADLIDILGDLSSDTAGKAQKSWAKNKGPMAAYWKAVSVYAKHLRAVVRKAPSEATRQQDQFKFDEAA